jgi:hypothetical protein
VSTGSNGFLGLLVLDTRFPRQPGDAGRADSWRMPVRARTVQGASPQRVVRDADPALLQPFIHAAQSLVAEGARAITTSCGLLLRWQRELQAAVPVPVWSSSLLLLPSLQRPGVLTVDAAALSSLPAMAGVAAAGLAPGCHLQRVLIHNLPDLDPARAAQDALAAAQQLVAQHPGISDVVLECTNLPPYADLIARATGRPVHHLLTLVHERWELL